MLACHQPDVWSWQLQTKLALRCTVRFFFMCCGTSDQALSSLNTFVFFICRGKVLPAEQSLTGIFASFFGKSATKVAPTPTSVMQPPDSRKVCCGACCRQYHHLPSAVTNCAWPEADLATSASALLRPYSLRHTCKLNLGVYSRKSIYILSSVVWLLFVLGAKSLMS